MEKHKTVFLSCVGLRYSSPGFCETPIGIPVDMGPSAFRCPVCNAIYVVDSLQEEVEASKDLVCGVIELDGHRVEVYSGERVQTIRRDLQEARKFCLPKVGGLENVYVAQVYLDSLDILKIETEAASKIMQCYRPDKPFSQLEQALGLMAFTVWLELREQTDEVYFMPPSVSARLAAIQFVEEVLSQTGTRKVVQAKIPTFKPEIEIVWAREKANHEQWKTTLTRAIIMLCRAFAYRYTGVTGDKSDLLDQLHPDEIRKVAIDMYHQALQ